MSSLAVPPCYDSWRSWSICETVLVILPVAMVTYNRAFKRVMTVVFDLFWWKLQYFPPVPLVRAELLLLASQWWMPYCAKHLLPDLAIHRDRLPFPGLHPARVVGCLVWPLVFALMHPVLAVWHLILPRTYADPCCSDTSTYHVPNTAINSCNSPNVPWNSTSMATLSITRYFWLPTRLHPSAMHISCVAPSIP